MFQTPLLNFIIYYRILLYAILHDITIQSNVQGYNIVYRSRKGLIDMKPLKSKVSITLDEDIIMIIKELAEEDDRSFSQYINMVLRNWIKDINSNANQK